MSDEKNVGKFEMLMIRVIQVVVLAYMASAQEYVPIRIPTEVALIFIVAVLGYVVNVFLVAFMKWVDSRILISQLEVHKENVISSDTTSTGVTRPSEGQPYVT